MKLCVVAAAAICSLGASLAGAAVAPTAQSLTLQDLENAGSTGITVGDKTFYDFSETGNVTPDQITVVPITGPNIGLEFNANWSSSDGVQMDSAIHYKVHVNDPTRSISGVNLSFVSDATHSMTVLDVATVTETISDLKGNVLGQINVSNVGPKGPASFNQPSNSFVVTPTMGDLMIDKDIMAHSTIGAGPITISSVDNSFVQTGGTSSVPLPPAGWAALGTLAMGGLAPIRRRVRRFIGA